MVAMAITGVTWLIKVIGFFRPARRKIVHELLVVKSRFSTKIIVAPLLSELMTQAGDWGTKPNGMAQAETRAHYVKCCF